MLNLKVTTLIMFLVVSAGVGAAGSTIVMQTNKPTATTPTAALDCKPSPRAETFRHADTVNTGRNKEY